MIQKPRGTQDYIGEEFKIRRELEDKFINFYLEKEYQGIETPLFEQKNLFVRSVGEETDIVSKELFDLEKKSEEVYSLRPEFTAGVIRSLIERGLKSMPLPVKVFSVGSCFRYERPQKGRKRQFNQLSIELIGKKSPEIDAQVIADGYEFLKQNSINVVVNLNTLGSRSTREKYSVELRDYLKQNLDKLCDDCKKRVDKNPLRVWDCKTENCNPGEIPSILDSLEPDEKDFFEKIQSELTQKNIEFVVKADLVRGLDYYTGVVFEYVTGDDEERQNSLGGGGRYDELIRELNGPDLPAVGYAFGFERVIENLN
ncbi:MAG: histidine--tRNA ligase [bacterium]